MKRGALIAMSVLFAGTALGAGHAAAEPAPARVVVIVPGQTFGPLPYELLAKSLRDKGYVVRTVNVAGADLRGDARVVGSTVEDVRREYPGSEISLVGHSVGGLSSRQYLKNGGGADVVSRYIAIGTPQYGSPGACGQPQAPEACPRTDFIDGLTAGDDTPGPTRYYSIRSAYEWADGRLDGGQCRMTPVPAILSTNGGYEHIVEPLAPQVWDQVSAALSDRCEGEFVDDPDGAFDIDDTLPYGWNPPGR